MASRKAVSVMPAQTLATFAPHITPRLLRIAEAAHYLSCTYGFMETLIREKTVPSMILGKRRVVDVRDLDDYIERIKEEAA